MNTDAYFGQDYAQARALFLQAAQQSADHVWTFPHPLHGPSGEALAIDIAWLGPEQASSVVLVGSATHGAEGLCGSGCQVGMLLENFRGALKPNTALVLVHANNPYGFAHVRRVNEDNIDLNRNFVDFASPLPPSDAYAELHAWLVPEDWRGSARLQADAQIDAYIERVGPAAYQQSMSQGQYAFPDGLFYGGTGPSWSRNTLEGFARERMAGVSALAVVDFHTGLGPRGYGEIIGRGTKDDPRYVRACDWYGSEVRSAMIGDSASVRLNGTIDYGYQRALPDADVTAITLEFGTLPFEQVSDAVRADNWLYARGGGANSPLFDELKAQIRAAFYGDDRQWRSDIWARGQQIVTQAIAGVASG